MMMETQDSPFRRAGRVIANAANLVGHVLGNVERLVTEVARDSVEIAKESEALASSVAERAGQVRDAVRGTPRFTRILTDVALIAGAYRLFRARAAVIDSLGGPEAVAAAR